MKKVAYEHTIPAPRNQVIDAYRTSAFYEEKQKSAGAISVEILEWEELANGDVKWRARITEPSRQPAFIRKSDVDTFEDNSVLSPEAGTLSWKITPSTAADKFKLQGLVAFHDEGESTRVVYNIEIEVKIPFVGSKVEKFALDKSEKETAKQAAFLRDWLARDSS
ncbi:MAG: DUF2505 domain-containing protein [Deltaproteobacteria bacterium]|nr:DUF2505 domain-containing protein [Deltaproteobacteria bacterium]